MKKVSVGEVKDVGVSPKRGKKKGFVILIIVAVILIALFLIGNTGCSSKKSSTTTPPATVMPIPDRVSGLESRVTYIENHPNTFDATALWSTVNALHNYDDTSVLARLVALEGLNMSNILADMSYANVRLLSLESYNISARLLALEARPVYAPTPVPTTTPTPVPNASVTPTPTPTTVGGNHAPVVNDIAYDNFSESAYYAVLSCNATDIDGDSLTYTWFPSVINNGHSKVYWVPPYIGWNGSTINISVIVIDSRGGNASFTRPIAH